MKARRYCWIGVVCCLLGACDDKSQDLGRGYRYVDNLDTAHITNPRHDAVVDPHISEYKLIDPYVVGQRRAPRVPYNSPMDSQRFGFFILDTRDGSLIEGLDKAGFGTALAERRLKNPLF